jgi:hypothetical protein
MATTTTNFGWDIPQSTDLVKDGATAIAALGQDIDTALIDLKGGTTGQVLAKASATDLDYSWTTPQVGDITAVTAGTGISGGGTGGDVTVTNSMATAIDAKGDLILGTGADAFSRLAVGSNDQVLTADSTTATGVKWAAPAAAGGMTLLSTTSLSGATTTVSSISGSYKELVIYVRDWYASSDMNFTFTVNGDTTSGNYQILGFGSRNGANTAYYGESGSRVTIDSYGSSKGANNDNFAVIRIPDYANGVTRKVITSTASYLDLTASLKTTASTTVHYASTTAISSLEFRTTVGTWSGGSVLIYGVN